MIGFCFESWFFLTGTNILLKVQARMKDKVRIKNLKSLFEFFEKFSRDDVKGRSKRLLTKQQQQQQGGFPAAAVTIFRRAGVSTNDVNEKEKNINSTKLLETACVS